MKTIFRSGLLLIAAGILLLFSSCKKNIVVAPFISSTPLYALIIGDTSLSVFNAAIQKAGDSVLFHGIDSITVLLPTNTALLSQGFSSASVKAMSAKSLDSMVRYYYISTPVVLADSLYTSFNSLLGPAVYGFGSTDTTSSYFNGVTATLQELNGSNALVYVLNAPLRIPATSITQLLGTDTSLTYFAEALKHTGISLAPASGWNTILIPDNNSFIAAGYATTASIDSTDITTLTSILQYHVLPGQYFTNNFTGLSKIAAANGDSINVSFTNNMLQLSGGSNTTAASVTQANRIAGTNIIGQKINELLMP